MKTFTLDEVTDKIVGKIGTENRDKFEYDLQMDLIGNAIKETRKERKLTQEDLGKLIGVQKAQISRLENNASNATIDTLMRVISALKATVKLHAIVKPFDEEGQRRDFLGVALVGYNCFDIELHVVASGGEIGRAHV